MQAFLMDVLVITTASAPLALAVFWVGTEVVLIFVDHSLDSLEAAAIAVLLLPFIPAFGMAGSLFLLPVTLPYGILTAVSIRVRRATNKPSLETRVAAVLVGFFYGPIGSLVMIPFEDSFFPGAHPPQSVNLALVLATAMIGALVGLFLPWRWINGWRR